VALLDFMSRFAQFAHADALMAGNGAQEIDGVVLLTRPALIVEGNDAFGEAAHIRNDEPDLPGLAKRKSR
jgi:hypothetical protein